MSMKSTKRLTERSRQLNIEIPAEKYGALQNGIHNKFNREAKKSTEGNKKEIEVQ